MKQYVRRLYEGVPLKRELYSVIRRLWVPRESIYRHLHFKGVMTVKVDERHSFKMMHHGYQIENEVFWAGLGGGWEKVSFGLWIALCRRAQVVLDIGANTGIYALIAKSLNPGAVVYAFEPVQRVYDKLLDNVRHNGFDIQCIPAAVSDHDGVAVIYDLPTEHIYSVTVNKDLAPAGTATIPTEVRTVTLDAFFDQAKLAGVDLIKIDVETHEGEVLEGCSRHLGRFRPTLLIEILNDQVGARVERTVEGMDYLYFNIDERSGTRRVERITRSDYYNYLLCSREVARDLGLA
jgi:FkbM family methyltransferase